MHGTLLDEPWFGENVVALWGDPLSTAVLHCRQVAARLPDGHREVPAHWDAAVCRLAT